MWLFMGQNKWFGTSHLEPKMKIFFFVFSFQDMATGNILRLLPHEKKLSRVLLATLQLETFAFLNT